MKGGCFLQAAYVAGGENTMIDGLPAAGRALHSSWYIVVYQE